MSKQKPSRLATRDRQAPEDKLWQFTVKSWAVTAGVLSTRRDLAAVLALLDFFDWLGDQNMSAIRQQLPAPACREGCAFCCHVGADRPDLLPPEALRIVTYLEARPQLREVIHIRLSAPPEDRDADKAACLFLQDKRCLVYAVRPLRCRAQTSPDAGLCRQSYLGQRQTMPLLKEPALLYHSLSVGLRLGLRDAGLQNTPLRLTPAIRLAWDASQAWIQWLNGASFFAQVIYPQDTQEETLIARFMRQNRARLAAEQQTMQQIIEMCLNAPK